MLNQENKQRLDVDVTQRNYELTCFNKIDPVEQWQTTQTSELLRLFIKGDEQLHAVGYIWGFVHKSLFQDPVINKPL